MTYVQVYYIPVEDVRMEKLTKAAGGSSFCEWKVREHTPKGSRTPEPQPTSILFYPKERYV
jgi:hypothetical protein